MWNFIDIMSMSKSLSSRILSFSSLHILRTELSVLFDPRTDLALSSALHIGTNEPMIIEVGEDKDIPDINNDTLTDDILKLSTKSGINFEEGLWTSPVPYLLGDSLELNAKGVILKAFDQFRLKSCIDFKPLDSEEYYISFQELGGCFSYIGKAIRNGQPLSIGRFCDLLAIVEHEILHALGFLHEQSRYDRDDYVTVVFENIREGFENNFEKYSSDILTTNGVPYDYWSVMHYGKNAFSNGNGSTIATKNPVFQDRIGQILEMSPADALELNLLYKCNSTIAFKMHCSFTFGTVCQMDRCSEGGTGWIIETQVDGGPNSDHTNLPSGSSNISNGGYFMHASTVSGKEGDLSLLETKRMNVTRECNVQCLQFYFYHSGNQLDQLNIWMREFQDEWDHKGTRSLIGQITGQQTYYWQLHHVSLNATKYFQVEFEVRKGAGSSSGGFSIDDINLSEIECPHVTLQIDDFERILNTSDFFTTIHSARQYSGGGYAYRVGTVLFQTFFGVYVQLLSGIYDDQLQWPVLRRQVTFKMLDQDPNIQLQMSKPVSITSDLETFNNGTFLWDNPREIGTPFIDENNETSYAGPLIGRAFFSTIDELKTRQFLKGGSVVFVFSFQDLTPLVNENVLPCPQVGPAKILNPPINLDKGSCSSRITSTNPPPPTTDDSIFGFSPGLVASPILISMVLILLIP